MTDGLNSRPKIFLVLLSLGISLLFLVLILTAFLPTILSSTWGKEKLFAYLKSKYRIDVKCERVSLRWFEPLEVTHLKAIDKELKLLFNCDIIKTDAGLWSILFRKNFGHLYLDKPYLKLTPSLALLFPSRPLLENSIQRASFFPLGADVNFCWRFSIPYFGALSCAYGKIDFVADGVDPIVFDEIALNVENSPAEHVIYAQLSCTTLQKGVQGSIHADADYRKINTDKPITKINAEIINLPVEGVDELVSLFDTRYRGVFVHALGTSIDLTLNGVLAEGNVEIDLLASSPLCKAALAAATQEDRISLKKPAQITYTLTPVFLEKIAHLDARLRTLSLQSNATVQIILSQFSSMIPHTMSDLLKASFDAEMTALSALNFECSHTPITLSGWNMRATGANGSMQCDGKASLMSSQKSSECSFTTTFNSLTKEASFSAQATDLPTAILGQIADFESLPTLIGSTIAISASGNKGKDSLLCLEAQSPFLILEKAVFEINDRLTLRSQASFRYAFPPDTIRQFTGKNLLMIAALHGRINSLSLPMIGPKDSALLDIELLSDHIALSGQEQEPLEIHNAVAQLSLHTVDQITLSLSSDRIQAYTTGKYQLKTGKITLTQPLVCTTTLDNALLHTFLDTPACLTKPADLKLSIDPFSYVPSAFSVDTLALKGNASIGSLILIPFARSPEISIQNLVIPFQWDGPQRTANLGISATVQEKEQSLGSFAWKSAFSNVQYSQWNLATATAVLEVQQMPSAFLDSLVGKPLFSSLLGPQFNTTMRIQSTPELQNVALTLSSPLLSFKSAFAMDGNTLSLSGAPAQIQWTLTPEGYKALDTLLTQQSEVKSTPLAFELKEPTRFQFALAKLELPLSFSGTTIMERIPKVCMDLSMLQLVGDGSNQSIAILDNHSRETIAVAPFAVSFNKSHNAPLTFACEANVATQQNTGKNLPASKMGSISLKGNVEHLFDEKGQMHWEGVSSDISLQVKSFPSRLLDLLARLKGRTDAPFTKVFGNVIQASLQSAIKNMAGPVSLNVNSPNVRFSLHANANQNALFLQEPIYAQMKITKEMSSLFLKEMNPLGITYFYSENPVTVEIPVKGFYLPLNPFNLNTLTIPNARVELGKIACRNEGNINIALGLLKTKQFEKNKELLLWFAPMDLHISKGIAQIERTEILLAQTYDIALWGKLLLVENYIDMVLGLSAETLNLAFGIKNLPRDYVLTIPMKGPADNVKINTSKATTKIALILASQQKALQDSLGKSRGGAFLGGLLQHMATLPDNGNVPPAKHPFPWEKGTSSLDDAEEFYEKKVHFKQKEKPLKQLLKIIR